MKVSLIIASYNEEKTIENCIKSLRAQTYKDIEIICVDDGSSDKTLDILKNYGSNIILRTIKHGGPAAARNNGAKIANGKILVFVDADMTFNKDYIKKLVEPIITKKSKGTFNKLEYVANWDNVWAKCWNINRGLPEKLRLPKNYPDTQRVFRAILKSEFDRVGGFTTGGYTDDWSLSEKLGYQATATNAINYHSNPDNLTEIYKQAKWSAKRKYKKGLIGILITIIRHSAPLTIYNGIAKSIVNKTPRFILFKFVFDVAVIAGIIEYTLFDKGAK